MEVDYNFNTERLLEEDTSDYTYIYSREHRRQKSCLYFFLFFLISLYIAIGVFIFIVLFLSNIQGTFSLLRDEIHNAKVEETFAGIREVSNRLNKTLSGN